MMTALSLSLRDSATMLWRDTLHSLRNAPMTVSGLFTPVILMVLFKYFFGGAIGAGFGGAAHGESYIDYIAPAIIIMTVGSGCATTAINLCLDVSEGVISRFRTMAIARGSVLTGQVLGSMVRTLISVTLATGFALLMGFRPTTNPMAWLETLGIVTAFTFGITWMAVVFGLVGKTPAGANSLSLIFQLLLPFTSSAFVPPATMPSGVRGFAENQPFTIIIDTVRGLLTGAPVGDGVLKALLWCAVFAITGYVLARVLYDRDPVTSH